MRSGFVTSWMLAAVVLATLLAVIPASAQRGDFKKAVPHQKLERLQANPASVNQVSDSVTNLAQKIARAIASPKSKTEIFSPVSIAGALSLLLLGASGRTQQELMRVMGFNDGQLSFQEIHFAFGRLFQDLVANDPTLVPLVTWRVNDKCNRYDEEDDYEDEFPPANTTANTKDLEIQVGNAIFAKEGTTFDTRYNKVAEDLYKSKLQQLDFEGNEAGAVRTINSWVNKETHGRISDIISHVSPETIMIIVNTLYFRGLWEETFQPMATKNRPFFPNGPTEASIDVPMMAKSGCMPYYFWPEENIRVLGVPYKQNVTMYILMPTNSTRSLVQALQGKIDAKMMNNLIAKMRMKSVTLLMPKMHVSNSISLKAVLEQLGAATLFQRESAELSRVLQSRLGEDDDPSVSDEDFFAQLEDTRDNAIRKLTKKFENCTVYDNIGIGRPACLKSDRCDWGAGSCVCCLDQEEDFRRRRRDTSFNMATENKTILYVSEMLHKVDLTVNEVGTEGGAATATLIDRISSQITFHANGPFVMVIREETTRLPLFYGTVYNPK
ncbi:serine protease inhibitor 28Dc-like isoform X2 [Anopheles coustani]|uniref:serine protease inhibitor 28Dc-like isoform X2 n=1 Tax=Anopheles coustani TaxID=139045 RepID=UPI002659F6CA|nr:serine protease inhibitor 28Dc-like isoform X2 [Anopheles coustani]